MVEQTIMKGTNAMIFVVRVCVSHDCVQAYACVCFCARCTYTELKGKKEEVYV